MTNQEAIETIKMAIAEVEWEYPMEYAVAFDKAIDALKSVEQKLEPERTIEIGNALFGNSRGEFHVPRGKWQSRFALFLDDNGFDMYGYIDAENLKEYEKVIYSEGEHHHYFENDIFRVMPYWWGDSLEIAEMPNFIYKPTGYEIQWYKWPLRDSYSNMVISYEEFCRMLKDCEKSICQKA